MMYLDHGATSFPKPSFVTNAVVRALSVCANPGRGGYAAAVAADKVVYVCREQAASLFRCQPEQVVFTANCTQGLNMAIRTLVKPGGRVVISGFEHNAVTRPLHALKAQIFVAGTKLFDPNDTLEQLERILEQGVDAAVFTHCSNVFGYILPIEQIAAACHRHKVPLIVDAAQSAGILPVDMRQWGAAFVAAPGHKGLLGPQGTGLLLCGRLPEPLLYGGTGSASLQQKMPDFLPDRGEAGTLNVPGIAGLSAGISYILQEGTHTIFQREQKAAKESAVFLKNAGFSVFTGKNQGGTVSFLPHIDCEEAAEILAKNEIAVRAGLHCAPLAHRSAGTLDTGTVRISFGHDSSPRKTEIFLTKLGKLLPQL